MNKHFCFWQSGGRGQWLPLKWLPVKLTVVTLLIVPFTGLFAHAAERPKPANQTSAGKPPARPTSPRSANGSGDATASISRLALPPARTVVFTEEREAAARAFVRKNRPEMDSVLDQLKLSKPDEYSRVICDLFRTSELFATMHQEDPQRHELALKVWQAEARTHLLAAELVAHPDQGDRLKLELRATVEELANLQIEQAALEVRRLESKLQRAEGQRKKIEGRRNEFVNERVQAILQAVERVDVGTKSESKPIR